MKVSAYSSDTLAKIFFEMGYFDEMHDVPFKPRAYALASETVAAMGGEVEEAWKRGGIKALKELPGIGQALAEKIDEFYRTGHVKEYESMKKKFPVDIFELASIEGIGPKTIFELYKRLKIKTLKDLKNAIAKKSIQKLPGFGEQSEDKIARGMAMMQQASGRRLLADILPIANKIVDHLKGIEGVKRCAYAGSLRRRKETVGDIDLLATSSKPERTVNAFCTMPEVQSVHERGKTRASVRLKIGIDADLRVVADDVYGATLQYFTGDKRHNVLLRERALSKGYTLNEYGLFRIGKGIGHRASGPMPDARCPMKQSRAHGKLIACRTEEDIYKALGMETPPPEIRVGDGEIEAAAAHRLPALIPYGSVRGDLQMHTTATDGNSTVMEMAEAAKKRGLEYVAITDHTKSLGFVHGLNDAQVIKQIAEIKKVNKKLKGFTVLAGTECDILKDGALDLKDETLAKLDWVGVSIHSAFRLPRKEQTARVLRAISNPHVDCYFHPTCRVLLGREGIDIDMDEVIAAAKKHRVALEIDCYPDRSDLNSIHVRACVRAGVPLVIDTDAHDPAHFRFLPFGEAIARAGWARKSDVLNTKSAKELMAYLRKKS
jgi:DNA polymerase (family X)